MTWAHAPGRASPGFIGVARRLFGPLVRLAFRPRIEGLEHLPDDPHLLVANHSGGVALAEIASFVLLWLERRGIERPIAGFAHVLAFRVFPLSWVLRRVGAVPSTYEDARATLAARVPLLVFPGGDHEGFRPIWQAHRVDFGGRRGFLRIAREQRVAVVPMGIRGSHFTVPTLWRSRLLPWLLVLPRALGLKRWPITLHGLAVAIAIALWAPVAWPWKVLLEWVWWTSLGPLLPIVPWSIRFRIGRPIPPEELFTADDESLERALERVEREVQALVDP